MKICHISSGYPPDMGGVATVVECISSNEKRDGNIVYGLVQGLDSETYSDPNGVIIHRIHYKNKKTVYSQQNILGKIKFIVNYILYHIHLIFIIKKIKPDIIHVHTFIESLILPITKHLFHIPYVLTIHGKWSGGIMFPNCLKRVWKLSPWLRNPNYITVLTDQHKKECLTYRSNQIVVIGNGVDNSSFPQKPTLDIRKPDPTIIIVSRLVSEKGLEDAICSMSIIKENYPNSKLMIIGPGPLEGELKHLISSLDLERNVILVGPISREDIVSYYHQADMYLLPSLHEGMPMVALEAMSCGLPLITTEVSILPKIVQEYQNGYIIPMEKPTEISSAIRNIHELDKANYHRMCLNSLKASENFSWDKITKSYLELYADVLYERKERQTDISKC